ncbi:unnamed protein product [Brassica napus]|uniref:(rape) hypothetical protein n=1 Tax=Brassica napus TaxID=3708 RepID=A0A816NDM1_BRANA|nr:unnamed protein product [Brassica napus]
MKTPETKSPFRSPPIHSIDLFASHSNSNLFYSFLTILSFGVIGVFISTTIISFGTWWLFPKLGFKGLTARDYLAIRTIFSSTDTVCTLQVLDFLKEYLCHEISSSQAYETPLLHSLVLGEGVVNDATSVYLKTFCTSSPQAQSSKSLFKTQGRRQISLSFSVVTAIQKDEGWCYIGCFGWSKKLVREESFFTCVACNKTNDVAELRYMAILSVLDDTGTSAFLGFDMKVTKMTGIEASEAAQIVVDTDLPRSLADIVGSTYTFQLRLKDFNFTANHQTFTISFIFPARELAPMPTFPVSVQVPEAVTPGSDARLANTCKVEEQATTSDVSLPGRLTAAKEQVVLEKMPRRKHV